MSSARANQTGNKISIQTATVIGAGTMGAAIAAHLANAGLGVFLLDMADDSPPPADSLSANPREQRNRIVAAGFERMRTARPAHLFAPQVAQRITLGNLDDDLAAFAGHSDWIIEAIVEQLAPKQALMAQLEQAAPAHAVISTNTSGLPIREIAQGRSPAFRRRFLGTHFFNPPRYLHLLEFIPTADTDQDIVTQLAAFATHTLGKGVVVCKDTPNFIANRMISFIISHLMEYAIAHGYTVEEVDLLAGPLIGRPRSGLFRLLDVIGVDVMAQINRNLYDLIPHDEDRETLRGPLHTAVWQTLMDHGHLGVKAGQGFYKTVTDAAGQREFWTLDLQAATRGEVVYMPPRAPQFPTVDAIRRAPLAQRLAALSQEEDRAGALVWQTTAQALVYAARRIPEITDRLADLDRVMRWGFLWERGPFELWDALGVNETIERMNALGMVPPDWVTRMAASGASSFYQDSNGQRLVYDPAQKCYAAAPGASPVDADVQEPVWDMPTVRRATARDQPVFANDSATLHSVSARSDGQPPALLLEFHSKLNALDSRSLDALEAARDALYSDRANDAHGLLIANDGIHFCVGANLQQMLNAAQAQQWDELASFIRRGQYLFLDLRRGEKPVVAAPFQRVLGGGVEVCFAAHRVAAHAETYMGLVEVGVGLIPGWGGCKEMVRRHVRPPTSAPAQVPGHDQTMPQGLARVFETIAFGKVSTSALDAQNLGYLDVYVSAGRQDINDESGGAGKPNDVIVMNPERLVHEALNWLYELKQAAPEAAQVYSGGSAARDALHERIDMLHEEDKLTAHDRLITRKLAHVLCGGAGQAGWQSEEAFLDLEREAFVSLAGEAKTQERMGHMLRAGKPLRN